MAASAFKFTDAGYLAMRKNTIDLENDTFRWVLITNTHTPNVQTDSTYANISTNETVDADYAQQVAAGLVWTNPTARDFVLDATDVDFGNTVTISARYLYLVRDADANGTLVGGDLIVGYYDLNDGGAANVSSTAGNFDIAHGAAGMFTETITPAS